MIQRHLQLGMQRQPQTNKAMLQRSFTLQPLLATSGQDAAHNAAHHQAINQSLCGTHQQPAMQQVKENREGSSGAKFDASPTIDASQTNPRITEIV